MRSFSFVVFDLDGVLVDTAAAHTQAYADLWHTLGMAGPDYSDISGRKTSDVVHEVTRELRPSSKQLGQWVRFKQERARFYLHSADLVFPDTECTLRSLAARGIRIGLGTGASRETTTTILQRIGLADMFSPVVTAEDVKEGKPAPEVYLYAMECAAASPAETIIVEDSLSGLTAALESGAHAISVRSMVQLVHPRFLGSFADLGSILEPLGFGTP